MTRLASAPQYPPILDFDACAIGQPVTYERLRALAENINHLYSWRRKGQFACAYQRDGQAENARGRGAAATDKYTWMYVAGPNTKYVRCIAVTLDYTGGSAFHPRLRLKSTTNATGILSAEVVGDATLTFPNDMQVHEFTPIEVTPGGVEAITVEQENSAGQYANILTLLVHEIPCPFVDSSDAQKLNAALYPPGQPITDTTYENIADAVQALRKNHKKVLFSNQKAMSTQHTVARDMVTRTSGSVVAYPYTTSPWLPETANPRVGVKAYVLAKASGAAGASGTVTLAFTGGSVTITGVTARGVYSGTGTITEGEGAVSEKGHVNNASNKLWIYGVVAFESVESGA